jgi:hypothetical protein
LIFVFWFAEYNGKFKVEMRNIYRNTEIVLKVMVASIKTTQKKQESSRLGKIKNQKPKNKK